MPVISKFAKGTGYMCTMLHMNYELLKQNYQCKYILISKKEYLKTWIQRWVKRYSRIL